MNIKLVRGGGGNELFIKRSTFSNISERRYNRLGDLDG